jgi:transposase-like protein
MTRTQKKTENQIRQDALLDELIKECDNPAEILSKQGLLGQLTKRLVERALNEELTDHLGYEPHSSNGRSSGNNRNGKGKKRVQSDSGEFDIEVPRDRNGSFEPQLVPKRQRRIAGFDDKVLAFYARGLTTRDIQAQLEEIYGIEVSPSLISNVTEGIWEEVRAWQSRPLNSVYPIIYFDAIFVKSREEGPVQNKAVYVALGVDMNGEKELLGLWMSENEGAKFWMTVFNELQNRGVKDCFIACVDGLKGLPEAVEAVFPKTQVQLCIVHKVRNSLKYVPWKERKAVATDLRAIYAAPTLDEAQGSLERFSARWDSKYPAISPSWRADWERLTVFFNYPAEIRKVIYTTNTIESLNYSLRKILKNRGSFPNNEAILKLLYLALRNISKKWTMPIRNWKEALNQFVILFEQRMSL